MAEQILPPNLAALLQLPPEVLQQLMASSGGQTPPGPSPMATALRNGELGQPPVDMSGPSVMGPMSGGPMPPMPPTLSGAENAPQRPIPSPTEMGFTPPAPTGGPPQLNEPPGPGLSPVQSMALEMTGVPSANRMSNDLAAGNYGSAVGNAALAAAPYVAGPVVGRAAQAVRSSPTLASMLAAGGGMAGIQAMSEPTPAGAQRAPAPSDAIRDEQRMLAREGFYQGPIDGVDGRVTQDARKAFADVQAQKRKEDTARIEREQTRALESAKTEAEKLRIQQQMQETTRLSGEAERNAELAKQGAKRFQEMKPTLMEQWGPTAGYVLGLGMGLGGRSGMGRILGREQRETGRRADDLAAQMGQGEVPDRVARVNQFWREGGSGNPPFAFQSGRQPFPWEPNPNASSPNQLFAQRGPVANYGPGAITGTVGVGEMGLGYSWLEDARRQEEAAREAIRKGGTTPANVQALEEALAKIAQAETMLRTGMGTITGGGVGELESRITRSRLKPSVREAEAERGRVDTLLNPQQQGRRNGPPNSGGGGSLPPITERRTRLGPLPGGHYVDPAAPPSPNESWVSLKGQKMWTRDANGRFRDEMGRLQSDPRASGRRGWRRISSADDTGQNGGPSMAEYLQG